MRRTKIDGFEGDVILTEGAHVACVGKIYGVFASPEDAASDEADSLALGTIGADRLTAEQIEIAEANSASLVG